MNGPVLKTGVRASVPWVRIPPPPPFFPSFWAFCGASGPCSHNSSPIGRVLQPQKNSPNQKAKTPKPRPPPGGYPRFLNWDASYFLVILIQTNESDSSVTGFRPLRLYTVFCNIWSGEGFLNEKTAYRLVSEGEIPGFKVGGSWRFRKSNIGATFNSTLGTWAISESEEEFDQF